MRDTRWHRPPEAKRPRFKAAVLYAMLLLTLLAAVQGLVAPNLVKGAFFTVAPLLNAIASALLLLKFLLPGWRPHRAWLASLLGFAFAAKLVVMGGYLMVCAQALTYAGVQGSYQPELSQGYASTVANAAFGVMLAVALVVAPLLSPQFHLLLGIWRKKSTERTAGVLAAVGLGLSALALPFLAYLSAGIHYAGVPTQTGSLWGALALSIFTGVGNVILFFGWPVLERPVLEKEINP